MSKEKYQVFFNFHDCFNKTINYKLLYKLGIKKDNTSMYEGERNDDGTPHGQGTYTFDYGDKYEGGFKDGLRHGQGIYTYADGTIKKGFWKNNLRLLT